jgi:putative phosphoesterase
MLIGILSDTHGHLDAMQAGIDALASVGAQVYIHCGDVGSFRMLDVLAGLRSFVTWGNTDFDRPELTRYARALDITVLDPWGTIELESKRLALTHGDRPHIVRQVLDGQQHDYLLTGHTHLLHDHRHGRIRAINPGALYRASPKTVAALDLTTDFLQHITVDV